MRAPQWFIAYTCAYLWCASFIADSIINDALTVNRFITNKMLITVVLMLTSVTWLTENIMGEWQPC